MNATIHDVDALLLAGAVMLHDEKHGYIIRDEVPGHVVTSGNLATAIATFRKRYVDERPRTKPQQ